MSNYNKNGGGPSYYCDFSKNANGVRLLSNRIKKLYENQQLFLAVTKQTVEDDQKQITKLGTWRCNAQSAIEANEWVF